MVTFRYNITNFQWSLYRNKYYVENGVLLIDTRACVFECGGMHLPNWQKKRKGVPTSIASHLSPPSPSSSAPQPQEREAVPSVVFHMHSCILEEVCHLLLSIILACCI